MEILHMIQNPNGKIDVGDGTQSSIDAAMDIAVIKELFTNLISIGEDAKLLEDEEMATYKRILEGAALYQTNEYSVPREWLNEDFLDNDCHRHQSHLYPIYRGLMPKPMPVSVGKQILQPIEILSLHCIYLMV